jgi:ribosomal protein L37AE/L43A
MNITVEECAVQKAERIFRFKCPKCGRTGSSADLIMGWLCPGCKTDFFLAHYRQRLENSVIRQTNMRIALLTGSFCERSLSP